MTLKSEEAVGSLVVTYDDLGIFAVEQAELLGAVSAGAFNTKVGIQTACANETCASYNNGQCGPANNGCAAGTTSANVTCGANQPCSLVNAGACGGGEIVAYQGDITIEINPDTPNKACL